MLEREKSTQANRLQINVIILINCKSIANYERESSVFFQPQHHDFET